MPFPVLGVVLAASAAVSAGVSVHQARQQRKAQKREAAIQAEAQARAERQKAHNDRELAWRRGKHTRRVSGYGVMIDGSGYPSGYKFR